MALFRPSCAVMRTSTPASNQWSTLTRAFARRYCSQQISISSPSRSSFLSSIQSQSASLPERQSRSFSTTLCLSASVHNPSDPSDPSKQPKQPKQPKKRTIRIGPLPNGEPSPQTIRRIFGPGVPLPDANNVLRILHHRRTSGSLTDYGVDNLGARYVSAGVDHQKTAKALEWLRETYPVDEVRAAEEWAEKEANRISYELWLADPENADSKYNDPARIYRDQQKEVEEVEKQEEQRMGLLRAGPSEFEKNIQRKRQQRLEAMAQKAEEKEAKEQEMETKIATGEWVRTPGGTQLMKPGQNTYVDVFGREQISMRKEIEEKNRRKAESGFESPEEMLRATTLVRTSTDLVKLHI
jgi:rhomboid-like protein